MEKSELGQLGENLAAKYLKKKDYKVIERNFRTKWGELDIVAISPEKILTLVEVKTVSGPDPQFTPEDQMTKAKFMKFRRAAEIYANGAGEELVGEKGYQLDLIAVVVADEEAEVKHYENV